MALIVIYILSASHTAFAIGRTPPEPFPEQPEAPEECTANFKGESHASQYGGHHYYFSCTDEISLKNKSGQPVGAPYTRITEYFCYGDDGPEGLKNKCQKRQIISDPKGKAAKPGNWDFSDNEYRVVVDQLIVDASGRKLKPNTQPLDPFESVERDGYVHPVFLRMVANDPAIEYGKREFAGEPDPYLDAHVLCNHAKPVTGTNFRSDQEEGFYFETDKEIEQALGVVADKIRLRLVDVVPTESPASS